MNHHHHHHSTNAHHDPRVAFFDHHAPRWEDDPAETVRTRQRLTELLPRLGLQPGQHILEVGCGTGVVTGWLLHHVKPGRLVSVDFSPAMLGHARSKNLAAEWLCHDICHGPVEPGTFDAAFCFHVFPHFRDPAAALRHLALSLKPDGRLLVVHLAGSAQINEFHGGLDGPVCHDHLPPAADWLSLLQPVGLKLQQAIDQPDLFLIEAVKTALNPATN
jgi:demethylmenaquinone methyltransferase/2-methoxy-6-polyprenyl-1,4-benzoquinol methylase